MQCDLQEAFVPSPSCLSYLSHSVEHQDPLLGNGLASFSSFLQQSVLLLPSLVSVSQSFRELHVLSFQLRGEGGFRVSPHEVMTRISTSFFLCGCHLFLLFRRWSILVLPDLLSFINLPFLDRFNTLPSLFRHCTFQTITFCDIRLHCPRGGYGSIAIHTVTNKPTKN